MDIENIDNSYRDSALSKIMNNMDKCDRYNRF